MRQWLIVLALLSAATCLNFQEAENAYCATHLGCPDGGLAEEDDAGGDVDAGEEADAG